MRTVVVTRHPSYVELLRERGLVDDTCIVVGHATPEVVRNKRVVTSGLPLHLAAEAAELVTVPLFLPPELRGVELTLEQVREHAQPTAAFQVTRLSV